MNELLFIVLGSVLATAGGILTYFIQYHKEEVKEARLALYEATTSLPNIIALPSREMKLEIFKLMMRIRTKPYTNFALKLLHLLPIEDKRERAKRAYNLAYEMSKAVNKAFHDEIEKIDEKLEQK